MIKSECEKKLLILEGKLTRFTKPAYNLEECLDKSSQAFKTLKTTYLDGDTTYKRSVTGSIFPEKMYFDGKAYRTTQMNEAAQLMYLINSELNPKKIGQT
jgi:site-specific DNA recombinase